MSRKHFIILGLFLVAVFLLFNASGTEAAATAYTWTGAGNAATWTDPGNWSPNFGGYPGATTTDSVTIATQTPGGDITVRATTTPTGVLDTLVLGGSGSTGGGPTLILGNGAIVSVSTSATVIGTSTLKLGDAAWGSGTLTLTGGGTPLVLPEASLMAATGTVSFTGTTAVTVATTTYYNLTVSPASANTFTIGTNGGAAGTVTVSNVLTVGANATLDGGGGTITLSGSGTPFSKANGVFAADGSTIVYSSASATNIATGTYANLTISGAATKTLLGNTTATSTVTVPSGATLAVSTYTFTATGATWTNSGIVTEGTGGKIVHASASAFTDSSGTAKSFFSENNGDSVYLTVTDTSLNFDASTAESVTGTATISASSDTSSTETITLTETGIKTGIFRGGARLASISSNFPGILECFGSVTLSALFTDSQETDTSTPSSATGLCANGGGGGGSSAVAATTVTTATTATTTATTTAATTTPVVTATSTATAVSTLETVQTKVASVIAKIAALPTNPTTSDLASIQAEIAAILIELQSIQAAQPTPQGVALGFNFVRPLTLGLKHADVSNLQKALKTDSSVYPEGLVTGYFGSMTLKAVQKFQGKYGIASPGVPGYGNVGPATRAKLNALYGSK